MADKFNLGSDVYQAFSALTKNDDDVDLISLDNSPISTRASSRALSSQLLKVCPSKYSMTPSYARTEFAFSPELENLCDSEINIEFWQTGISGISQYLPGSQNLDAYGIKRFDMVFYANDELINEHLEVQFVLQLDEKAKTAKVLVVAQKKGMSMHLEELQRADNFTLEIHIKNRKQVHRVSGRMSTKFSEWKEKLEKKINKSHSPTKLSNFELFWMNVKLADSKTPLTMGMDDMCKIDAELVHVKGGKK